MPGATATTRIAAVQMVSGPEIGPNLEAAGRLIAQAAAEGARFVALPENFYLISADETAKVRAREADGRGPIQDFLAGAARRNRVWLAGGTCPIECGDPARIRSACLLYDDAGRRVARYDKMHLFGFAKGEERYDEAATIEAGSRPVALDTPFGRLGLAICYDLRFPELFRRLGTVDLLVIPAAFTDTTGRAHWEMLLRARAVENQCYVLASAQGGRHPSGRMTHGNSMVIDPWGEVLARLDKGEGVAAADLDAHRIAEVRQSLPALRHRRPDLT